MWKQLPLVVWLVVLWVLLWDELTVVTVVSGVVVAAGVIRAFYLPAIELSGRFNIYWAAVFAVRFIVDVITASVHVAWQAVDLRHTPRSSLIAVDLHTRSDIVLTLTGEAVSLVPGSLVVEVDRPRTVLYLHVLGTKTLDDVEKFRGDVLKVEERIVRALGSAEDIRRINRSRVRDGRSPIHRTRWQLRYEQRIEEHSARMHERRDRERKES
nr:Na+/H+ antiporter subunit E [Spelaeicoccus albus]